MSQERLLAISSTAVLDPRRYELAIRKPQRMTITVPCALYERMLKQSDVQGRSLSNLACHWLELHADQLDRAGMLSH